MLHQFSPVSLNCSICSLVMLYAGLPPVLGSDEITFLTSSVGQLSTTSPSFSISLSVATIKLSSKLPHDGFGTVFLSTLLSLQECSLPFCPCNVLILKDLDCIETSGTDSTNYQEHEKIYQLIYISRHDGIIVMTCQFGLPQCSIHDSYTTTNGRFRQYWTVFRTFTAD